jgi:hypothetical protein
MFSIIINFQRLLSNGKVKKNNSATFMHLKKRWIIIVRSIFICIDQETKTYVCFISCLGFSELHYSEYLENLKGKTTCRLHRLTPDSWWWRSNSGLCRGAAPDRLWWVFIVGAQIYEDNMLRFPFRIFKYWAAETKRLGKCIVMYLHPEHPVCVCMLNSVFTINYCMRIQIHLIHQMWNHTNPTNMCTYK